MRTKMEPRPTKSTLDDLGREIPDPVPMAPPVGYQQGMTQEERLRAMVRQEQSRLRAELYDETEDEANDFDVDDDPIDPATPYEQHYEAIDARDRARLRDDEWRANFLEQMRLARLQNEVSGNGNSDEKRSGDNQERSTGSDRDEQSGQRKEQKTGVQSGVREGERDTARGDK